MIVQKVNRKINKVIGQQQVQGLDYAYTIEGWLKGVNSTDLQSTSASVLTDMGGDGVAASPNRLVAQDAYGFSLNYFTVDYAPINAGVNPFPGFSGLMPAGYYKPLYNGNISAMAVNIGKFNAPLLYNYQYDQLNRIVAMDAFTGLNPRANIWNPLTTDNSYQERISYDANGNILTYLRNGTTTGGTPLAMDNLTYQYFRNTDGTLRNNRLRLVRDSVPSGNYTEDIDDQLPSVANAADSNYLYDAIGNLIKDKAGNINTISWTVYGKISSIAKTDGTTIAYTYDAAGNRISKTVTPATGPATITWYVRDATGNVMAVYTAAGSDSLHQSEQHLYGSSRLGIYNRNINADATLPAGTNANLIGKYFTSDFTRGNKLFELSNHLGNVLVTVSDKKIGVDANSNGLIDYYTPDVVTANDYYPFGSLMPGRQYSIANTNYRYGFNGKENDNDIENGAQDYGMRIYDTRLGRFLSVDPLTGKYPELTSYQFSSNRPIDGVDLNGLEYTSAANWAQKNIADYTIRFNYDYQAPPTFKSLRQSNWRQIIGNTMYCATSTALSYAQADPKVANVLQKTGFKSNRGLQLEYFQKGNKYASLIKSEDFGKASRGDLLFLQNPDKLGQAGEGHVAVLATNTRSKGEGTFTVNVYSTNAGNSNNPERVGTFGEAIYLFAKNKKGETQLMTKYWYDTDYKVFRSQNMRNENLILQGFGRIKEDKIKKEELQK